MLNFTDVVNWTLKSVRETIVHLAACINRLGIYTESITEPIQSERALTPNQLHPVTFNTRQKEVKSRIDLALCGSKVRLCSSVRGGWNTDKSAERSGAPIAAWKYKVQLSGWIRDSQERSWVSYWVHGVRSLTNILTHEFTDWFKEENQLNGIPPLIQRPRQN